MDHQSAVQPSNVFAEYGRYYDLLYADKDYAAEADYVACQLREWRPGLVKLIELGSGTGRHGRHLARAGFDVTGIERSLSMLAQSEAVAASEPAILSGNYRSIEGDVRTSVIPEAFEAAISLFHVVSYQSTNDDLLAMFTNAARHLVAGGLFLFDVWYAPAVLTLRPETRVKRLANDGLRITRIAEPTLHSDENCVDVHYQVFIEDASSETFHRLEEQHRMRYFTTPEIGWLAALTGFQIVKVEEWLTGKAPSTDTWGVCYLLRKESA